MREIVQVSKKEEDEEEDTCFILPPELLRVVASYAFARDPGAVANIRSVCKSWKFFMDDHEQIVRCPIPSHPSIQNLPNDQPYLLSLKGDVCVLHLHGYTIRLQFPELAQSYIRFSKFGWLLLSRRDKTNFLFNMFTRQKIELPNAYKDPPNNLQLVSFSTMCFSCPPTSPHCYILGWTRGLRRIYIINRGEEQWSVYEGTGEGVEYFRYVNSHPIFLNDHCYCMGDDNRLIMFDLKNKFLKMLPDTSYALCEQNCFLARNAGDLVAVFAPNYDYYEEESIYIARYNITEQMWQPMETLENKSLFVSHTSCFLSQAPTTAMANKIIFPRIRDNYYVVHSLATQKYHSFLGDYSCRFCWDVKELTNCTWIEPVSGASSSSCDEKIKW